MQTPWTNGSALTLLLIVLVACAAPAGQSPDVSPSATLTLGASPTEPSLTASLPLPSGMVLPPIVDPDRAGPPYARGEPVQVDDVTVVYEGTFRADGRFVARFQVTGVLQSPPGALFFLPSGPSVDLAHAGSQVASEPFALRGYPKPSTLFAWLIESETLVWELGPIDAD